MNLRRAKAGFAALAVVLSAGCSGVPGGDTVGLGGPGEGRFRERYARSDPSKVIAAELAFARAAQEKGQWTAFAEFAADDAVMFVPQPVRAKDWLKGRANPARAVAWQPHEVWSSCDGTLAVTAGAWQRPDGTVGYFTTAWQRQGDGSYKWLMDQGDVLEQPQPAPEMVDASTAQCTPTPTPAQSAAQKAVIAGSGPAGSSRDGTLLYAVAVAPDNGRTLVVMSWNGSDYAEVLRSEVAAPQD